MGHTYPDFFGWEGASSVQILRERKTSRSPRVSWVKPPTMMVIQTMNHFQSMCWKSMRKYTVPLTTDFCRFAPGSTALWIYVIFGRFKFSFWLEIMRFVSSNLVRSESIYTHRL